MTEMRAVLPEISGRAVVLDPENPAPFAALAGEMYLGMEGDAARVRTSDGHEMLVYPGWVAVEAQNGKVAFSSPDQAVVIPAP